MSQCFPQTSSTPNTSCLLYATDLWTGCRLYLQCQLLEGFLGNLNYTSPQKPIQSDFSFTYPFINCSGFDSHTSLKTNSSQYSTLRFYCLCCFFQDVAVCVRVAAGGLSSKPPGSSLSGQPVGRVEDHTQERIQWAGKSLPVCIV